ncbi:transposase [Metarhizium guizhouense ARSEF 977]|uniref:Transposase n=1 Tax=Metarhizium guizhouense (strain ARSEF 977) TaxID=1276136 RepID=A0A0B4H0C0_METGA|nr:transposase [Metarhizium guizhouense ARSEF 977]
MPQRRSFGTEISANRQRGYQHSSEAKASMLTMLDAGVSARRVAQEFNTTHSTVLRIKKTWTESRTLAVKPRKGRPLKLSRTARRYIIRMASRDRQISYDALIGATPTQVSRRTIQRVMATHFGRKWKAMDRPKLDAESARQRLQWAEGWLPDIEELEQVIFSDETSVQNKSSNPQAYVFRFPHEKYNMSLVNLKDHVKPTLQVMMWGGIWKEGRTPLVVMTRDEAAQRRGYIKALREGLLPHYDGTRRFQQDNARIHTSHTVTTFLQHQGIEDIDWPKNSPDLNPIEHYWAILKRQIRRMFPHLRNLRDNSIDMIEFQRCVQIAHNSIPQQQITALIDSMERRLRAVIRARGWYTRY